MSVSIVSGLLDFLSASPTPFQATQNLANMALAAGFVGLDEKLEWDLQPGGKYFYSRSDSAFVAFTIGEAGAGSGFRVLGTHSDSPCLKVKPSPELNQKGYSRLGVEIYGGVLLNTWFDRDLSLAGKVSGLDAKGQLCTAIVDFKKAIASVPSLAIHLDRSANINKTINPHKELNVLLSTGRCESFRDLVQNQLKKEDPETSIEKILDYNLSFYDTQPASLVGLNDEFIASARLDNLLSTYIAAKNVFDSSSAQNTIFISNDHEEVGSCSESGAQGTMLSDLIERIIPVPEMRQRALRCSLLVSIDNAHALHPNYPEKHDDNHGPMLTAGPVIKFNANQSYATSSDTSAVLHWLAQQFEPKLPLQSFSIRADMSCGSTIGPLTASNLGIKTVDLGVPQFAMHSIRELAAVGDVKTLYSLNERFLNAEKVVLD